MVLFSVGLPGRFAEWCDGLMIGLAARSFGAAEGSVINSLDEFAAAVLKTRAPQLVACSRQPALRLQSEIIQSNQPFLIAWNDPRAAVRHLVQRTGRELAEATREVANSCAAMSMLTSAPKALVVSDAEFSDPIGMASAIARHFGLPVSGEQICEVVADLARVGIGSSPEEDSAWQDTIGDRGRAVINGALQSYVTHLATGAELEQLVWERELFYLFEDPPAAVPVAATRPVDVTGRARVLVYGPSMNLPPGEWSADVILGFSAETAGMSFLIDAYAGRQLSCTRTESTGAQVAEVRLRFVVEPTFDHRVEIRVLSEQAAFDGRLALGQVTLRPQETFRSEAQDYLTQVLHG